MSNDSRSSLHCKEQRVSDDAHVLIDNLNAVRLQANQHWLAKRVIADSVAVHEFTQSEHDLMLRRASHSVRIEMR